MRSLEFPALLLSLLFSLLAGGVVGFAVGVGRSRRAAEGVASDRDRRLATDLTEAVVAVCAHCRRARTERGWRPLADALEERLGLRFSHGICPDCAQDHFPELRRDDGTGH